MAGASAKIEGLVGGVLVRALLALPDGALNALGGRRPPGDAAALAPDAWLLAKASTLSGRGVSGQTPAEARARMDVESAMVAARLRVPVTVEERTVAGLRARLYVPDGLAAPSPLLVFFHGGGWVIGSLDSHDPSCRLLADEAGVRVLAIDYRMAPEHRFPAAADDALAAFRWAAEHAADLGADPARIAVGGDSAGGNLAAVTALRARDEGGPQPAFQLLIYPAVDFSRPHRESRRLFGQGFLLTDERMDWFEDHYVPDPADKEHPHASPMLAASHEGLPPAHIATAVTDPLRDEGEEYAERLRAAGVPVSVHRHPHVHGFFNMTATRTGRAGVAQLAGVLHRALSTR